MDYLLKAFLAIGGLSAVVYAIRKPLTKMLRDFTHGSVTRLLNPKTKDPKKKKLIQDLVMALVRLAEYEIPDRGQGQKKWRFVATWIITLVPMLSGQKQLLANLIRDAVASVDDELKRLSK